MTMEMAMEMAMTIGVGIVTADGMSMGADVMTFRILKANLRTCISQIISLTPISVLLRMLHDLR